MRETHTEGSWWRPIRPEPPKPPEIVRMRVNGEILAWKLSPLGPGVIDSEWIEVTW